LRKVTFSGFALTSSVPLAPLAELPREDGRYSSNSTTCSILVVCKEYHTSVGLYTLILANVNSGSRSLYVVFRPSVVCLSDYNVRK